MENKRVSTWKLGGNRKTWLVRTRYCGDKPCEGDQVVVTSRSGSKKSVTLGRQVGHDRDKQDGVRYTLHLLG